MLLFHVPLAADTSIRKIQPQWATGTGQFFFFHFFLTNASCCICEAIRSSCHNMWSSSGICLHRFFPAVVVSHPWAFNIIFFPIPVRNTLNLPLSCWIIRRCVLPGPHFLSATWLSWIVSLHQSALQPEFYLKPNLSCYCYYLIPSSPCILGEWRNKDLG